MLTNDTVNEVDNKIYQSDDDDEKQLDLDLPVLNKKKVSRRVFESSESEDCTTFTTKKNYQFDSESESELDEESESDKQNLKKEKGPTKYLSNELIINSDLDGYDEPELSFNTTVQKEKKTIKSKAIDFVKKASGEDFKSTLKFIDNNDESESEADDEGEEQDQERATVVKKVKKPKETLKSVLKESEALLRRQELVSLPIEVIKPQSLTSILNEALAINSKSSSKEAAKRVIEEKKRLQRLKLEKIIGKERMSDLIKDNPRIGHDKLDEAIEIYEVIDEKAPLGESEKVKVKLIDLPDKHFDSKKSSRRTDNDASYRVHLRSQKKPSIEVLNETLKDKISAQSDALLSEQKHLRSVHLAGLRVKEKAREQARRRKEAQRERELQVKREKKCDASDLFSQSKKKYEGIERVKGRRGKIIISSEEEEGSDNAELLNFDNDKNDSDLERGNDGLPEMNDAMTALLSGKFESETEHTASENDTEKEGSMSDTSDINDTNIVANTLGSADVRNQRKQSEFIDDEASDEDEEMEGDDFLDEEALELDMQKSKFIAESSGEENDPYETIQFINQNDRKKDEEVTKRLLAKYGKHVMAEEDELFDNLGKRYGIIQASNTDHGEDLKLDKTTGLDEDIQRLLDPIERKKRKLAALGSWSILKRQKAFEAADEEFRFKDEEERRDGGGSSDYYASESDTDSEIDSDSDSETDSKIDRHRFRHDCDDEKYYEPVESGLQSRVEEMLNAELLDTEEVQVQASVSLSEHLNAIKTTQPTVQPVSSINRGGAGGVTVPQASAKLKSRLLALQQENEDGGEGGGNMMNGLNENKSVFKGFTTYKK